MAPHRLKAAWPAICLALGLVMFALAPPMARADSIDDVASVMDTIDSVVPKGTPDGLPFNGDDLRGYRTLIKGCEGASGADDVIACIDAASSSDAGKQANIPDWFPQMLDVYFDIEHHDYWGLFQDGGEAVACATGQALTGGIDVCGAIKELIKAAKEVAAAAEAVGQFFADLGEAVGDLGEDIVCLFSDCDDGPPKLSDSDKAYNGFYFPRIGAGLAKRMAGKLEWTNYSGEGENFQPQVIDEGLGAAGGFTYAGLKAALPKFIFVVNTEWDAKILSVAGDVQKVAYGWNPSYAKQVFNQISGSLSGYGADIDFYKWRSGVAVGKSQAHDNCAAALKAAGGQQVDDWVAADRPSHLPAGKSFSWPDNYTLLCKSFDTQLDVLFRPFVIQRYYQHVSAHCTEEGESSHTAVYTCVAKSTANECRELMQMWDGSPQQCKWTGAGKAPYHCTDGDKMLSIPEPVGGYKGCKRIFGLPGGAADTDLTR